LVLIAAIWALVPTFKAYQLDQERLEFIRKNDTLGLRRWDSIHGKNYREDQRNLLGAYPIKRGLDLQGGIYITMEVDVPTMLAETAQRDAVDETFNQVINLTRTEAANSDEPVLDIFMRHFRDVAVPKGKTLLSYYDLGDLGANPSDDQVLSKLSRNVEDAVDQAVEVVRQRIDKYGVTEPTIQKTGRRIIVELPGVTDEASINNLLQTTARLEFKLVKNDADAVRLFQRIDAALAGTVNVDSLMKKDSAAIAAKNDSAAKAADTAIASAKPDSSKKKADTAVASNTPDSNKPAGSDTNIAKNDTGANAPGDSLSQEERAKQYLKDHPFTTLLGTSIRPNADADPQQADGVYGVKDNEIPSGDYSFLTTREGMERMKAFLARPEVKGILPEDRIIAFSAHPERGGDVDNPIYGVYVLTSESELGGDVVSDAAPNFDPQSGQPMVTMAMTSEGADKWAEITGANIKKRVAIVLDSAVYSAPTVQNKITGGSSQITGSTDIKEASLLAVVLKAGALKAPVRIIQGQLVGPSLGDDSIKQGINATLLAAGLVILFMLVYYSFGGIVADLAVIFNLLVTLAILALFNATLTLPGIGGLVLTIGMAVDGNILIYERIREEMASGKSLRNAVQLGYDKAFAAIIDTHITTFMTGAILYMFGSGPIKGFAVTLMIGIAATLFTAVFVTKTVFLLMLDRGTTNINFGQPKEATT